MSDYTTYLSTQYHDDVEHCKQYLFSFGSNYAQAVKIFPQKQREATTIFYSFVRYADELVDNPETDFQGRSHATIHDFVRDWSDVRKHGPHKKSHHVLRATYWLFSHYGIPFEYLTDFLNAMVQDLTKPRYQTYQELIGYMWGSASVVGHVMTFILGYKNELAFPCAQSLAEAMQLTNFLRDIKDDYETRKRIYLPQQDMAVFGVTEEMIYDNHMSAELTALITQYVRRCYDLYDEGIDGIMLLHSGRLPVYYASLRYRHYLKIIKQRNYNIFEKPIKHSTLEKILIGIYAVVSFPFFVIKKTMSK
jgi:phytoene synthase